MSHDLILIPGESLCYCEFQDGGLEKNSVICERNGTFNMASLCGTNEICRGPSTTENAVKGISNLCEEGRDNLSLLLS